MFIRLFLIVALVPLQSCSNTLIGEQLENSFDTSNNSKISGNNTEAKEQNKLKKIKLSKIEYNKENKNTKGNVVKENFISNGARSTQKSTQSIKNLIFTPQPYRIILKLSGANPSAPAETITKALRKAGIQFEVEKIERVDEESFLKDSSLKRKEF